MVCRQCNGHKRLLKLASGPPQFVVCQHCRWTGESDLEPLKPKGAPDVIYETAEAHHERNGGKW